MYILMDKKIIAILHIFFCLTGLMALPVIFTLGILFLHYQLIARVFPESVTWQCHLLLFCWNMAASYTVDEHVNLKSLELEFFFFAISQQSISSFTFISSMYLLGTMKIQFLFF